MKSRINELLSSEDLNYSGTGNIVHIVDLLHDHIGIEEIKKQVKNPLKDLKVATHYGCHLIRPSKIMQFDHPERPEKIDLILEALGAKTVKYANKLECCGFCARLQEEIGDKLVEDKMTELCELDEEVDGMIAVCPACTTQYDRKERVIARKTGKELDIPVLYLAEIMAIALGVKIEDLSLSNRSIKPKKLIEKLTT